MQTSQPVRTTVLPSPSSLNFPIAPISSLLPATAIGQASAQSTHLQDLQHQISVKTLAFQTLQREYDSLLQKLERQRTKCATLEKKFEVSDVEINSLTDEKEKMQTQVAMLESQVEELQQSRDDARHQLIAQSAQYMRIIEMANRLQGQAVEDRRNCEAERGQLEQRIKNLEQAVVTGTKQSPLEVEGRTSTSPGVVSRVTLSQNPTASTTSQAETISVLRTEVGRLQSRTQILEAALQIMRQESITIQAAARQIIECGGKLETVASSAINTHG